LQIDPVDRGRRKATRARFSTVLDNNARDVVGFGTGRIDTAVAQAIAPPSADRIKIREAKLACAAGEDLHLFQTLLL
jgi:hypothetical protein